MPTLKSAFSGPERLLAEIDQRDFCKRVKSQVRLGGRKVRGEQFNIDENDTLLRDKERI